MSENAIPIRIGVLALQGSFREHMAVLHQLPGVLPVEVRTKEELRSVSGLIIPGEVILPGNVPPRHTPRASLRRHCSDSPADLTARCGQRRRGEHDHGACGGALGTHP